MLETIKSNALSTAMVVTMILASAVYLSIGVSVISGSGWDAGPRVAAYPTATPTPAPAPTPCSGDDPRDPKKPCPTPIPSPTMRP